MFHRAIVILTVLAIIACPMFCREGTGCCVDAHRGNAVSSSARQKCSCCCHKSNRPQEVPRDTPDDSDEMCQGVCGGVVMLEPVKLETRDDLLHAVPFEVVAVESCLVEFSSEIIGESVSATAPAGRSLRTLLSSYLC